MKIGDISKIYGVYENKALMNRQVSKAKPASKLDKLSLSSDAKDFQSVMKGLKDTPDVREEKVQEVTRKYESPGYYPDYREVAEGLLRSGVLHNVGPQQD